MANDFKQQALIYLQQSSFDQIADIIAAKKSNIRFLRRLFFHPEELIRWRAIEAMGVVVDRMAASDYDAAREVIRNLFWSINDESGGIGWGAPECIGEIIYRCPGKFGEFASVLLASLDEPPLQKGIIWAAGRIAEVAPELVRHFTPELESFLTDPNPLTRGYVLRFLAITGQKPDGMKLQGLINDHSRVRFYQNGQLEERVISDLVAMILA